MSYATARDAILAKLVTITGFSADNVGYEDYQCLNAGVSRAIIVRYQSLEAERSTFGGGETYRYQFNLELKTAYTSLPESRAAEDTDRQRILDAFNVLDSLGDFFESWIGSARRSDAPHEIGDSRWLDETFVLTVTEET